MRNGLEKSGHVELMNWYKRGPRVGSEECEEGHRESLLRMKRFGYSLSLLETEWDQGIHGSKTIEGEFAERIL